MEGYELYGSILTTAALAWMCRSLNARISNCQGRGMVVAVHKSDQHTFSKVSCEEIVLVAGMGVEGDVHSGPTVKHRSRDPSLPNLRQVHLIPKEHLDGVNAKGYTVPYGSLGENITTMGLDLHSLPVGTLIRVGPTALLAITGERNPCPQIENYQKGLLKEMFLPMSCDQSLQRRAGVMAVVIEGGVVQPSDLLITQLPPPPHSKLGKV